MKRTVGGRSCVVGPLVAFDVDDQYAYDIDEPVELTLTYAPALTTPFVVGWDRNGGDGFAVTEAIEPVPGDRFREVTITLDRARLAGRGIHGTDLAVGGRGGVALCDIELVRSGTTTVETAFGRLRLDVQDAVTRRQVPTRVGLYDATGRAPLPSDQALLYPSIHRRSAPAVGESAHAVAVRESPGVLRRRPLRSPSAGGDVRAGGDSRPRVSHGSP